VPGRAADRFSLHRLKQQTNPLAGEKVSQAVQILQLIG
jgi:hypothetical protein